MTELQERLVRVMAALDQFLRSHSIPYYMLGGTMLGAVRHKGFIPWDDDIDIGIPREDYERFLKLAPSELAAPYIVRHVSLESNVPYAFAHIEDRTTTCIENRRDKDRYAGGVYIEIFPLDGCPDALWRQKLEYAGIRLYKKLLYGLIMDYDEKHRVFYKAAVIRLIRRCVTIDQITRGLDRYIASFGLDNSRCICNKLGHWGIRENIPVKVFGTPKEYEFEGHRFLGVGNPEYYLTSLYGADYMIPPSAAEQEQGKHPVSFLDLSLPYEEYRRNR